MLRKDMVISLCNNCGEKPISEPFFTSMDAKKVKLKCVCGNETIGYSIGSATKRWNKRYGIR